MTKKDQRQREWTVRIADYKASGLTMAAWSAANHVTLEQLKYWIRKLKKISPINKTSSTNRFVPLSVSEPSSSFYTSSLVVRVGRASIELQKGFDPQLLNEVVEALSSSC